MSGYWATYCSPRLYRGNPFLLLFTYLSFEKYPSKVDSWLENLDRQKWKPDDYIKGHIWSVCRNTDNNELGFVRFSSTTSNFLDNTCTKVQNMAFKTSHMDQIALEYWYYGSLGRLRVDGRGFLHQTPILKNCSPERNQVAAHAQKHVTVPWISWK